MKLYKSVSIFAVLAVMSMTAWATTGKLTITADEMTYNGQSKIATVKGNVVINDGANTLTGQSGTYNTASQEAELTGSVKVTGPDLNASAATVHMYGNDRIVATGDVYIKKGTDQLTGAQVDYNTDSGYGVVSNGSVTMESSTMWANHIEAWTKGVKAIGQGNVILRNSEQNLYAKGDRIDYNQTPGVNDGVAYLTGHAYAEQNGNTLQGEALKVTLNTNSIETEGRSTLVISQ